MLSLILSFIFHIYHLILGVSTPNKFPPPLSAEEEKKHFERARNGNEDSRQKLILHNLRLVSHIVRKYYSNAPDSEEKQSIHLNVKLVSVLPPMPQDVFKTRYLCTFEHKRSTHWTYLWQRPLISIAMAIP